MSADRRGPRAAAAVAAMAVVAMAAIACPAACYRPRSDSCVLRCGEGGTCPDEMTCSNGLCGAGTVCPAAQPPAPICTPCPPEAASTARCRGDVVLGCLDGGQVKETACTGDLPLCAGGACVPKGCPSAGAACAPPTTAGAAVVAGWNHTCALLAGGRVKCWGDNRYGQLGLGDSQDRGVRATQLGDALPFVALGAGRTASALVAGGSHTCALLDTGQVKCWGNNGSGQLGLGDTRNRGDGPGDMDDELRAVDLGAGRTAVALAAGGRHTCALLDTGRVKCFGAGSFGQLGLGDTRGRGGAACEMGDDLPAVDLGDGRAVSIAAGSAHTCALMEDGVLRCWGQNDRGQLGLGDVFNRADGAGIVALGDGRARARALAAGDGHTCAVLEGGALVCWGANRAGQLGIGDPDMDTRTDPSLLPDVPVAAAIEAATTGNSHTCALLAGGAVKCWGGGAFGQLGLGATANRGRATADPVEVIPPVDLGGDSTARATAVVAAGDHTCAVLEGDAIKCWGDNSFGQLGLGDTDRRGDDPDEMGEALLPVQLTGSVPPPAP